MQSYLFHATAVAALFTLVATEPACFYPDGKNATGLVPCKSNADVSHCCRESDVCLSNGLCFSPGLGSDVRRACTDKSWKSPDCPNYCNIDIFRAGDAVLTPCGPYNSFCCGQDEAARSCCDTGNATLAVQIAGGDLMSGDATCPGSGPGSSNPTDTDASGVKSLRTERNALLGLTVAFGCAMLIAAALAIYWRRRMKKQEQESMAKEKEGRILEREKRHLWQEKQIVDRAIASMPISLRRELDTARRNAGLTT